METFSRFFYYQFYFKKLIFFLIPSHWARLSGELGNTLAKVSSVISSQSCWNTIAIRGTL